jgi:hypothetical protein
MGEVFLGAVATGLLAWIKIKYSSFCQWHWLTARRHTGASRSCFFDPAA